MIQVSDQPAVQVLNSYKSSVFNKNLDEYMALYEAGATIFDMWGPDWQFHGLLKWRESTEEWFSSLGSDNVVVDYEDIQINQTALMASVMAIVKYSAVGADGQVLRYLQNRLTWVLAQKADGWKILHQHTSSPINHANMQASLKIK